jgi:hypothetical protein
MPLKIVLRVAILAEIVLAVTSAVWDIAFETRFPEPLRNYLDSEKSDAWSIADNVVLIVGVPTLIAMIVGWIGLWRLWRPARSIYLYSWVAGLLLTALSGPTVFSALAYMLSDAAVLSAGLIFGLIYFSDLRHAFGRQKTD